MMLYRLNGARSNATIRGTRRDLAPPRRTWAWPSREAHVFPHLDGRSRIEHADSAFVRHGRAGIVHPGAAPSRSRNHRPGRDCSDRSGSRTVEGLARVLVEPRTSRVPVWDWRGGGSDCIRSDCRIVHDFRFGPLDSRSGSAWSRFARLAGPLSRL